MNITAGFIQVLHGFTQITLKSYAIRNLNYISFKVHLSNWAEFFCWYIFGSIHFFPSQFCFWLGISKAYQQNCLRNKSSSWWVFLLFVTNTTAPVLDSPLTLCNKLLGSDGWNRENRGAEEHSGLAPAGIEDNWSMSCAKDTSLPARQGNTSSVHWHHTNTQFFCMWVEIADKDALLWMKGMLRYQWNVVV